MLLNCHTKKEWEKRGSIWFSWSHHPSQRLFATLSLLKERLKRYRYFLIMEATTVAMIIMMVVLPIAAMTKTWKGAVLGITRLTYLDTNWPKCTLSCWYGTVGETHMMLFRLCHSVVTVFERTAGGRNSSVGSAWAHCPQRRGFDPPLGTFSGRGDFSLGVNMGSNSIPPKTPLDESINQV